MLKTLNAITPEQLASYEREGFVIIRGLFSPEETAALRQRLQEIGDGPDVKGFFEPNRTDPGDPLQRYPRIMHPHRFDALSKQWMLDQRIHDVLADLMSEEPIACQSMFYFKPPGAHGQAFHQDNFYLAIKPSTCVAAWVAVDAATPETGGIQLISNTQSLEVQCPREADSTKSFTTHFVPPPPGTHPIDAILAPGDTLFFNGNVIHGSQPNAHPTAWHRAFICHYMPKGSTAVSQWYFPLHDFKGNVVEYPRAEEGGPCGSEFDASKVEKVH